MSGLDPKPPVSPLREAWVCTNCGSEKTKPDEYTPMGQYRTGLCEPEGKHRPLILKGVTDTAALVARNEERHRLKKLSAQIRRGSFTNHVYTPMEGVFLNEATGRRRQPPCATYKGCNFGKAHHPKESDLRELGYVR